MGPPLMHVWMIGGKLYIDNLPLGCFREPSQLPPSVRYVNLLVKGKLQYVEQFTARKLYLWSPSVLFVVT